MEFSLLLISKLSSLMIMAVVGYIVVKAGVLKSADSKVLSNLIVFVLQPCMFIQIFQIDMTSDRRTGFIAALIFAFAAHVFWILLTALLKKPLNLDPVDRGSLIYVNCGNLILPLVAMTLGDEHVFYAAAFQVPFHVFLWTQGYAMMRGDGKISIRRLFLNSNVISLTIGLFLMVIGFKVPEVIGTTLDGLSGMVGPASMLVVGMVIADADLKSVFLSGRTWMISFGRLIVYPLLTIALLYISGILRRFPDLNPVFQVSMLAVAAPCAGMITQLAVIFDKKKLEASSYNVLSTMLCTVTMPLIIMLYGFLFPA